MSEQPKISDEAAEYAAERLKLVLGSHGAAANDRHFRRWAREVLTAAYPLLRRSIEDDCERDAALLLAAVIAQTGPVMVPNNAMADRGHLTLQITRSDDGVKFSIKDEAGDHA